jgi:CubicO group peptidase (beta-lactamase class C family)
MMSPSWIDEFVRDAGYAEETPLAAGVSLRSQEPLVFAQGAAHATTPFGPESVAYAASIAKQLTGACAAMLEQDGVLDYEARINEWLPELPEWSERVRVRHLIHHTAGLPKVWPRIEEAGESDWTSPAVLAALTETQQLDHEPGTAYAYSNEGYICLALMIERISGSSFETFARGRIFRPLKMTSSIFWAGPSPAPRTAAATPGLEHPAALSLGDGGLWTTIRDLLAWNAAVLEDAFGIASRTHTAGRLDDGTPLDYAWGVRVYEASGQKVQSHGGGYGPAPAKLVRLPDSSASFAILAADSSVERMLLLAEAVQASLIGSG